MVERTLITGGAGFIGFHLAKLLASEGHEVTILDNFARGQEDNDFNELIERDNVEFIKADITDRSVFDKLDKSYDWVYHMAMINGTSNFYSIPDKVLKIGIVGTLNTLDWFSKQNKGKLLFTSSSETYAGAMKIMGDSFPIPTPEEIPLVVDDPKNVRWSYGGSKILSEIAVFSYAAAKKIKNYSIVRYHNIYGPRMGFEHVIPQFIERIVKKESPFKIFGGQETRTFCYVDDGIKATRLIMESPKSNGEIFNIGRDDDEIKIIDMAKKLNYVHGSEEINFEVLPAPVGCVKRRCPDVSKLKSLGFNAKIELDEGLKKCLEWYKDKF